MPTLKRFLACEAGTFGILTHENRPLCMTLEPLWRGNQKNLSCIPPGNYVCTKHNGEKFKNVWRLLDVPGRSDILIHSGNTVSKDTQGCILVGLSIFSGGIADSLTALEFLRKTFPSTFRLDIVDGIG